jgi:hypothetical protein
LWGSLVRSQYGPLSSKFLIVYFITNQYLDSLDKVRA